MIKIENFRAWDPVKKEMTEVSHISEEEEKAIDWESTKYPKMRDTGEVDMNGQKIYAGDITKLGEIETEVKEDDDGFYLEDKTDIETSKTANRLNIEVQEIRVIGNKYEGVEEDTELGESDIRKCPTCGEAEVDKYCVNESCVEFTRYEEDNGQRTCRNCLSLNTWEDDNERLHCENCGTIENF